MLISTLGVSKTRCSDNHFPIFDIKSTFILTCQNNCKSMFVLWYLSVTVDFQSTTIHIQTQISTLHKFGCFFQIVFLAVIALLARSCSAAKAPSLYLCQKCKDDCQRMFMKCITGCRRHTVSGEGCVRKLNKCDVKCEKKFGTC